MMKNKWLSIVVTLGMAGLMIATCAKLENELATKNIAFQSVQKELSFVQEELSSVVENLEFETTKSNILAAELDITTKELTEANDMIYTLKSTEYELVYIGDFKLTHYCTELREHICGTGNGITATGTQVTAGRTIAVDPKVIPYGSQVYIEGYGWRTAEDCGGWIDGNHIDIAVETHADALSMGVANGGVWLLIEKSS